MPAAIAIPAIATVVGGGVAAAASIYGANQASDATRRATAAQTDYNNRALVAAQEQRDYQRNQQNQYQARLAPYAAGTMPAFGRLNGLLDPANIGMTGYALPTPSYVPPQVQPYAPSRPGKGQPIGGGQ